MHGNKRLVMNYAVLFSNNLLCLGSFRTEFDLLTTFALVYHIKEYCVKSETRFDFTITILRTSMIFSKSLGDSTDNDYNYVLQTSAHVYSLQMPIPTLISSTCLYLHLYYNPHCIKTLL